MKTTVHVSEEHRVVTTTLPGGHTVFAAPEDTEEERARATALGYTGPDRVWHMTRDHDRLHVLLAEAEGKRVSDALWLVAHPASASVPKRISADREERVVLLMQHLLNVGIDALLDEISSP